MCRFRFLSSKGIGTPLIVGEETIGRSKRVWVTLPGGVSMEVGGSNNGISRRPRSTHDKTFM